MLDVALKVLAKIEEHGFKAYIVGGFVRDYLLGNVTNDVDICTDATPMDIKLIFDNITLPRMDYGAVRIDIKKHRFDIMTFRKEISYYNNRKPMEVEYIKDLKEYFDSANPVSFYYSIESLKAEHYYGFWPFKSYIDYLISKHN